MKEETESKSALMSEGARQMAHKRWANVPSKERRRLTRAWGKLGGRPRAERRCFCGAVTMKRAESRSFDCCRAAGLLSREAARVIQRYVEAQRKTET